MTAAGREAAERRQQEAAAEKLVEKVWRTDVDPITNPVVALQRLAGQLRHAGDVLGERLAVESLDGPTAIAWTRVLRELRQALEGMERLGLAEKELQLTARMADVVVAAHFASLDVLKPAPGDRALAVSTFYDRVGDLVPADTAVVVAGEVES